MKNKMTPAKKELLKKKSKKRKMTDEEIFSIAANGFRAIARLNES